MTNLINEDSKNILEWNVPITTARVVKFNKIKLLILLVIIFFSSCIVCWGYYTSNMNYYVFAGFIILISIAVLPAITLKDKKYKLSNKGITININSEIKNYTWEDFKSYSYKYLSGGGYFPGGNTFGQLIIYLGALLYQFIQEEGSKKIIYLYKKNQNDLDSIIRIHTLKNNFKMVENLISKKLKKSSF